MNAYGLLAAVLILGSGCHHPPLMRRPARIASVPFEYGTNAVLQIDRKIRHAGVYDLHLNLRKDDIPRDTLGRWPTALQAPFQVLVTTNGVPAQEKDLSALAFNSSHDQEFVRYGLASFVVAGPADVQCLVRDTGDGTLRMHGILVFERRFPK